MFLGMEALPRNEGHALTVKIVRFALYGKANRSDQHVEAVRPVCCQSCSRSSNADRSPNRSDRYNQSAQNANWTSPLRRSRRDNQNAYVRLAPSYKYKGPHPGGDNQMEPKHLLF